MTRGEETKFRTGPSSGGLEMSNNIFNFFNGGGLICGTCQFKAPTCHEPAHKIPENVTKGSCDAMS